MDMARYCCLIAIASPFTLWWWWFARCQGNQNSDSAVIVIVSCNFSDKEKALTVCAVMALMGETCLCLLCSDF